MFFSYPQAESAMNFINYLFDLKCNPETESFVKLFYFHCISSYPTTECGMNFINFHSDSKSNGISWLFPIVQMRKAFGVF